MPDPIQQEQDKSKVVDLEEARLAREQKMEEMEAAGEIVEVDGEKIPIDKIGEVSDLLAKKAKEYSGRIIKMDGLMDGLNLGDIKSVKSKLLGEQKELEGLQQKAETERESLEAFKKFGGSLIKLGAWIPGSPDLGRLLDRHGGRLLTGEDGYFLTPEQHAKLAKDQAKVGKTGLKVIGIIAPEAKGLAGAVEPFRKHREELEEKKEEMAKRGEKMEFSDEMSSFVKVIPDATLKDPKVMGQLGELLGGAGGDLGGEIGKKFGQLGEFVKENPDSASEVFLGAKKLIAEKKFNVSPKIVELIQKHAIGGGKEEESEMEMAA